MTAANEMDQILADLEALPDETTRRGFLARPEIAPQLAPLVEKLAARVDFLCRSNPQQSPSSADLALLVAEVSGQPGAKGFALRAKGHSLRALGQRREALPYYEQAIALFKRAKLAVEEGRTYQGELAALDMLGEHAECLRRGEIIRRRLLRLKDRLNLARLEANLGNVNCNLGRYTEGIRRFNRAIKLLEELGQTDLSTMVRMNRANAFTQVNRFREAAADYEVCRESFSQKGMHALASIVDTNLGFLLFNQARYNEALTMLAAARDGFEATGQPDKRAQAEADLAYCYSTLGLYDEALAFYEQAHQTLNELGVRSEVLRTDLGRAQVLMNRGDLEQAGDGLNRLLEVYNADRETEQNQHTLAVTWLYLAQLQLYQAAQPDSLRALELCQQAKELFTRLKLVDWQAQSLIVELAWLGRLQRWEEAEKVYRTAENLLTRLKLPHLYYQLYYNYGQLHQKRLENLADSASRKELSGAAYREFLKAAEQVETIRARLRPEEWRSAFMANGLGAYEALVELCLQDSDNPRRLEEAFSFVERSKSRSLLDLISQNLTESGFENEPEQAALARRIEQLRQELNWFYSQLHSPAGLGREEETQRLATLEIGQVTQEVESREREISRLLQRYRSNFLSEEDTPALPLSKAAQLVEELRQELGSDQTLVEYYVLNNRVIAFVLTREGIQGYQTLCPAEQVNDLLERLNYQANKFNLGRDYVERRREALQQAFTLYLHELYQLLIAPLSDKLKGDKLIVVPHSNLHALPFHAFYDGTQYLIDRYEISYAPSAGVLLHCLRQPERPAQKLLALGVPDEYLTGVEAEVRGLAEFFPANRLLVGEEATLAGLQTNLEWCEVLHLASHGIYREDNPLFSLLKLADGWLSVNDVRNWRFRPNLVTLSACQTGLSRPMRGDELLGLARGFLSAGAYALVVSLWSVNDEITTRLMHFFYESFSQSQPRATALRQAMLKLKAEEAYKHPHYWAGFILIGRP
jgi:CHAT domain-containing protein/predicted negative regulator of RcsB-dependent stress response